MNGLVFTLFALAAFVGGFVSGFSGFAMGLVVSGVWLHIITPMQTATWIAGYGLLTQGYGIFKLRQTSICRRLGRSRLGRSSAYRSASAPSLTSTRYTCGSASVCSRALHDLRPNAACVRSDEDRSRSRHCDWRLQRLPWRSDGTRRRDIDNRAKGAAAKRRAARGVSAGAVCGVCGYLDISSRCWYYHQRNAGVVGIGSPIHGRRSLVWLQTFWKDRRRDIPKDRAGASAVRRPVADHAVLGGCPFAGVCLCWNAELRRPKASGDAR